MADPDDPPRLRVATRTARELVSALESAREDLPDSDQVRAVARRFPALPTATPRPSARSFRKAPRAWQLAVLVLALGSIAVAAGMLRDDATPPPPPSGAASPVKRGSVRPRGASPSAVEARTTPSEAMRPHGASFDGGDAPSSAPPELDPAPVAPAHRNAGPTPSVPRDFTGRPREADDETRLSATTRPEPATPLASDEASLLGRAQSVLASEPKLALRLTEQHRRDYPRGRLAQEREMIAIQALVALGRRAQGSARAQQFRSAHPSSVHRRRLDALLPPAHGGP
jgi:hypothetical protein